MHPLTLIPHTRSVAALADQRHVTTEPAQPNEPISSAPMRPVRWPFWTHSQRSCGNDDGTGPREQKRNISSAPILQHGGHYGPTASVDAVTTTARDHGNRKRNISSAPMLQHGGRYGPTASVAAVTTTAQDHGNRKIISSAPMLQHGGRYGPTASVAAVTTTAQGHGNRKGTSPRHQCAQHGGHYEPTASVAAVMTTARDHGNRKETSPRHQCSSTVAVMDPQPA